jgi:hypothetical protein
MKMTKRTAAAVAAAIVGPATLLAVPADAHVARGLGAEVITANLRCPPRSAPFCAIVGRARIVNVRAPGTAPVVACLRMQAHTRAHRSLSVDRRSVRGQGSARLPAQTARVARYATIFDSSLGVVDHLHIVGVHVARAGRAC